MSKSTCQVDADELEVDGGGALVFMVADAGPPTPLRRVFVLSARSWRWAQSADAGVSWSSPADGGQQQSSPPERPPRILPATSPVPARPGWVTP
jgi:hypothetical protein